MFHLFFQCIHCHQIPDFKNFPLCLSCSQSLLRSPALCSSCAGIFCKSECLRPWIHIPEIKSFSACYLLAGPGYPVLRRWKVAHGPLFDKQILKEDPLLISHWNTIQANVIIPIPQRFKRSWQLGGSPAERIGRWISRETKLPLLRALKSRKSHHQAKLSLHERLQNPIRFEILNSILPRLREKKVILVDDFMTSGHTLRNAAKLLLNEGIKEVHAFCLGIRPVHAFRDPIEKLGTENEMGHSHQS